MNIQDIAKKLNEANLQYGDDIPNEIEKAAKQNKIVIMFGNSDDLVELRGAVHDEVSAYNGTEVYFDTKGLLVKECDNDDCPHEEARIEKAELVKAHWCFDDEASWKFETTIPHESFKIHEDGEVFCIGIVLSLEKLS